MTKMQDRKCPTCGATLIGGTHRCDYCGADWKPAGWSENPPGPHPFSFVALSFAIIALILAGNVRILILSGGIAIAIAFVLLQLIKKSPERYGGKGICNAAIVIVVAAVMLGIIYRVSSQRFAEQVGEAPMTRAQSSAFATGRSAKIAQEIYYQSQGDFGGTYAKDLETLLRFDKSLTMDPNVTFIFGPCSNSGYIFTVKQADSPAQFVFK